MKWFGGSIPEAISSAKTQNAIFVVYVYDSSDASKATDEVLVDTDISAVLSSNKFVAIKLENGTESALQFSQIYPLVLVPSLFFISGQTGLPLEVLGGPLTKETIRQKLTSLVPEENQGASSAVTANENVKEGDTQNSSSQLEQKLDKPNSAEDGAASASALIQSPKESTSDDQASPSGLGNENKSEANVTPDSGIQDDSGTPDHEENDSEAIDDSVSLEERVERAKVLLAQKRAAQAQEKAHEERQKEMERRKMGQEIAKRKLEQENKEIRAAAEERRKDKEEDRLARERVKAQIAADRAEREARQALLRGEEPPAAPQARPGASVSVPAASSNNSNISRIKFRLPDGSSSIAQFSSSTTLEEVRQHVRQNINLPFSNFTLTSTVHNRPFTSEDNDRSLTDLGLVPSAILIILSQSSIGGSGSVVPSGGIVDFFWILLSPITFLLGLVRQLFGGNSAPRSPSTSGSDEPTAKRAREEGPSSTQQRPQTAYGTRAEARLRREGNIHRLRNNDDDDDENNTWNGNSTQQM